MDLDLIASTVDTLVAAHVAAEPLPGLAYGVVHDGRLVHSGGLGTLQLGEERPPAPDSVFRIASMTKSFTAATLLLLRDEGLLRLDDPVGRHVPELSGPAADERVTLRHLLTMTAGFPTDDPWGDRQQGLAAEDFSRFLRHEPWLAWRTGDAYEYSNLGYALLGLVIESVSGSTYQSVVQARMLGPLGLDSTVFTLDTIPPDRVATGYVRHGDEWVAEPPADHGAFAPMGGLFSSVSDLARWMTGLVAAEAADQDDHPLAAASRREMQRTARLVDADLTFPASEGEPELRVRGYGFGLVEEFHPEGRTVSHSGGYPGFGSHMRWHPESGLAIVALGSRTYAPMTRLATEALRLVVRRTAPAAVRRPSPANPRLDDARAAVTRLLAGWDDDVVEDWFADNMAADEPYERRAAWLAEVRRRHGRLSDDLDDAASLPAEPATPSMLTWWLVGERGGRVKVDLMLSPHSRPLIQWLAVTSVPEPPTALVAAAGREVAARGTDPRWAGARLGPAVAGDGATRATFRVVGGRLEAEVSAVGGAGSQVVAASWRVLPVRADIR